MAQFRQDKMTEKERWEALMNRQPVDRVPLFLFSFGFASRNVGYSLSSMYEEPEKSFWAQVWTNEMYGATYFTYYPGGAFPAREFGGEVKMPEGQYSMAVSVLRPPVESEEDVWKLKIPDVKTAVEMPFFMQFNKLQERYSFPITIVVGSTLTRLGYMCGIERLCKWMKRKPELVHRLCRLETDFVLAIVKYMIDLFGSERLIARNVTPTESNQIISPKAFEEFVLPYQREQYEKARAMGIKHFFTHICGEHNLNLPYWAQLSHGDPGIISIGHELDIEAVAKYFPNDIILGNINPTIIQNGTPREVYEQAKVCIEKGKKCPGGFILGPGCELPVMAPPYNVWMLRKAVNDFGWYD